MQRLFVFFPIIALILFHTAGPSTSIAATATHHHNRRVLHHPLFPVDSPAPTPPPNNNSTRHPPPSPSAHPLSSTPASSTTGDVTPTAPSTDTNPPNPFFPTYSTPPPPPDTSGTAAALPTFPANISSLVVPGGRSPSPRSSSSSKLIAVAVILCIVAASLIVSLAFLHHRRHRLHHHHHPSFKPPPLLPEQPSHSDDVLLPPTSDNGPPKLLPRPGVSNTSSEFLYLGTISCSNSREFEPSHTTRVDSPEIRPLPPLPSLPKQSHIRVSDSDVTDDEEFYSPTISSGRIESFKSSSSRRGSEALGRIEGLQPGTSNFPDSSSSSPENSARSEPSVLLNSGTVSSSSCSPDYIMRPPPIIHRTQPPPPLPSPPPTTGRRTLSEPPVLPQPTRSLVGFKSGEQVQPQSWSHDGNQRNDEAGKPKLKGLHWDKVRPNPDRLTAWSQLDHRSSLALNEEMRENVSTMGTKDLSRRPTMMNQEYRVLDPNKSQNIAILLRSLNVSVEEVCDSLLEGNADMLGTELLESLLRMTPTDEEERKLKSYEEDDSALKLGPAEKLLKAIFGIPFVFKRVDAMLYMANFDSEVDHLHRSFQTLELASEELRSSRMFLKLLEAVLETGKQGDTQAFKLDTLLKLVDVKGKDGKTTLLHFVVQEIMKAEGSHISVPEAVTIHSEMENKRRGLQVVAGLCGELTNVKKAAAMNSNAIASDFHKLVGGIVKVHEVAKLNEETGSTDESNRARFADSISEFEKRAHGEIMKIRAEESSSLSKVKEVIEYFHGDFVQESAHPLRIFTLVRDFLSVLDQVCKEASKANERTMISSARQFVAPLNPVVAVPFSDDGNGERRNGERPLPVEDTGFF